MNHNSITAPRNLFIEQADRMIIQHLHDKRFSIDQLCSLMKVSRMTLHRKIKSSSGKNTTEYIRSFRLKRARQLLIGTDLSIKEIAYWVGFNDQGYFSKMFIKEFKITPSKIRK